MRNENRIVLSISILVSGRPEMQRCLESLTPLRQAVPCELILVDTGCNQEELALAERYADQIIPFDWCDDFSAARNAGLKEAKGEWFLFLDDDEWFTDVTEIADFFRTGEYRKYEGARYYVRNYSSREKGDQTFVDTIAFRMVRRTEGTRFQGIIHEYLWPKKNPIKNFSVHVEHYGYVFETEEDRYRHFKRNAGLLRKQIGQAPEDLHWRCMLAQEYMAVREYEGVISVCQEALEVWRTLSSENRRQWRSLGAVYSFLTGVCEKKRDYEGSLFWAEKGLREKGIFDCARAYLYQRQTMVLLQQKEYSRCLTAFLAYDKLYRAKGQDKAAIAEETMTINSAVFQEDFYIMTVLCGLTAMAQSGETKLLKKYFYTLDWKDRRLFGQEYLEEPLLRLYCEAGKAEMLPLIRVLGEREHGILELAPVMAGLEREYREAGKEEALQRLQEAGHRLRAAIRIFCPAGFSARIGWRRRQGKERQEKELHLQGKKPKKRRSCRVSAGKFSDMQTGSTGCRMRSGGLRRITAFLLKNFFFRQISVNGR
ncbi:MAG: glycosyltransferase [Roseburia sp.]|nr:glycosyltransferase [Roseburia sp.]MCM1099731.1 glycosyltransferase [Ruminococcus flavefaciens]